jgi:hypothetical protein
MVTMAVAIEVGALVGTKPRLDEGLREGLYPGKLETNELSDDDQKSRAIIATSATTTNSVASTRPGRSSRARLSSSLPISLVPRLCQWRRRLVRTGQMDGHGVAARG